MDTGPRIPVGAINVHGEQVHHPHDVRSLPHLHHHPQRRPETPTGPPPPPPDFSSVFWQPDKSAAMTIFDIDPEEAYVKPAQRARDLQQQCQERLAIYNQLEKAIRDEEKQAHPSWWRRFLRSSVWRSWWFCCGTCCLGDHCGDECCLGYSPRLNALKHLGEKCWDFVHDKVWGWFFLEVITYTRMIWIVLKSGFSFMGLRTAAWM